MEENVKLFDFNTDYETCRKYVLIFSGENPASKGKKVGPNAQNTAIRKKVGK